MTRIFVMAVVAVLVTACGGGGGTSYSCGGPCPAASAPAADMPENLVAELDGTEATLTWDEAEGAESYHLYYASDQDIQPGNYATYDLGTWVKNVRSPITITLPEKGPDYYFVVTALNEDGHESQASDKARLVTRYEVKEDDASIIRDLANKIEWKRCSEGQTWDQVSETCDGEPSVYSAVDALRLFRLVGDLWRVPTGLEFTHLGAAGTEVLDKYFPNRHEGIGYIVYEPGYRFCRGKFGNEEWVTSYVCPPDLQYELEIRALLVRKAGVHH